MTAERNVRRDKLIQEKQHDAYKERKKWPEPTRCTECNALFAGGRWSWNESTEEGGETVCPACRRTADRFPAGIIQIRGSFFKGYREEMLSLIRNIEKQEKSEHPMERIISMVEENEQLRVETTGVHIARRIGEAIARSYKGALSFEYSDGDAGIRVYWER